MNELNPCGPGPEFRPIPPDPRDPATGLSGVATREAAAGEQPIRIDGAQDDREQRIEAKLNMGGASKMPSLKSGPVVVSGPHPIPTDHGLVVNLADRFNPHTPKNADVAERMARVRGMFQDAAFVLYGAAKNCRERSIATTKLQEAAFWAAEAIGVHQNDEDP